MLRVWVIGYAAYSRRPVSKVFEEPIINYQRSCEDTITIPIDRISDSAQNNYLQRLLYKIDISVIIRQVKS